MKIAVTDSTFEPLDLETEILQPLGCAVVVGQRRAAAAELVALVKDADSIITQFAPLTAAVIEAMENCRVIVRYGTGVDNIDLDAAAAKGIPVCNVPDYCTDEVADHTLALILALNRQVVTIANQVREGAWKVLAPAESMRVLREMTVGIVGYGRIGREVARRLKPFKCRIQAFDPAVPGSVIDRDGFVPIGLDELFRTSDLITLHCPSTVQTRSMVHRERLAGMKQGVLLVNVARGDLIRSDDLIDALNRGQVAGAALDVTDPEPINRDSPLLAMSNVIITNHIASLSVGAVATLRRRVAQTVVAALRGERLANVVNGVGQGSEGA